MFLEHKKWSENWFDNLSLDDNFIAYVIVPNDIKIKQGKLAAQVGHAIRLIFTHYLEMMKFKPGLQGLSDEVFHKYLDMDAWIKSPRIVVLQASKKEYKSMKNKYDYFSVKDFSLNIETAIALWPRQKSATSGLLRRLRCL